MSSPDTAVSLPGPFLAEWHGKCAGGGAKPAARTTSFSNGQRSRQFSPNPPPSRQSPAPDLTKPDSVEITRDSEESPGVEEAIETTPDDRGGEGGHTGNCAPRVDGAEAVPLDTLLEAHYKIQYPEDYGRSRGARFWRRGWLWTLWQLWCWIGLGRLLWWSWPSPQQVKVDGGPPAAAVLNNGGEMDPDLQLIDQLDRAFAPTTGGFQWMRHQAVGAAETEQRTESGT